MFRNQSWMVVVAGLAVGGSAFAEDSATSARDDRLEDRVEARLQADEKLKKIDVDVDSGVVTMSGEVASRAERARAERLAKAEGARRIVNKLEVDLDKAAAAIDQRAQERKEAVDARADRQKELIDKEATTAKDRLERATVTTTTPAATPARTEAEKRAEAERRADAEKERADAAERRADAERDRANTSGAEKAARDVGDAWVTTKVKTKILADDLLDKSDLDVDTDAKGVVTLSGTVPSEAARARAVEVARTTEGVRRVVDKVVVGAPVVK
jgi:osmotically-inducible protein OsmY